jgi:signal transduction histidine kinase
LRLQTKINLLFSILVIALASVLSYFFYTASTRLITDSLGIKAKNMAKIVAGDINIDELQKVVDRTKDMKDKNKELNEILSMPEYKNLRELFWNFKRVYSLKYIYIVTKSKSGETIYVIDGFPMDYKGKDVSLPGDVEINKYELLELAVKEGKVFTGELSNDKRWGANVASYVPLFNSKGDLLGVLGIDLEAQDIYNLMDKNRIKVLMITAIAVIITLIIFWISSRLVTMQLQKLFNKIKKVREGDFSVKFDDKTDNELGEIEAAFDELVSIFNDSNISLYKSLIDISKSHKVEELEQKIVSNIKNIVPVDKVMILKFDGKKFIQEVDVADFPSQEITDVLASNIENLKIGDILRIGEIYLTIIGNMGEYYQMLLIDPRNMNLSQRDRLSIRLLSRYTAIFYENLSLIEDLSEKLMNIQNEGSAPTWMSKIFLQISEKERKRLASDLHDEVLQSIIKMKKDVSNLLANPLLFKDDILKQIKKQEVELENLIILIRETCNELLPTFLAEKGIVRAVEGLIERVQLKCDININFEAFSISSKLEYDETLTIYRVVQELINNAVNHSKATEVDIMLREDNDLFVIYYHDNGIGMDLNKEIDTRKHLGFHGIKERIRLLNGSVSCCSDIGEGLELSCQFPLKCAAAI